MTYPAPWMTLPWASHRATQWQGGLAAGGSNSRRTCSEGGACRLGRHQKHRIGCLLGVDPQAVGGPPPPRATSNTEVGLMGG